MVRSLPGQLLWQDHSHLYDSNIDLAFLPYCSLDRKVQLVEAAVVDNQEPDAEAVGNFEW